MDAGADEQQPSGGYQRSAVVLAAGVLEPKRCELGGEDRDQIPSSVRSSPGGYRSYSFWHTGYHGGK